MSDSTHVLTSDMPKLSTMYSKYQSHEPQILDESGLKDFPARSDIVIPDKDIAKKIADRAAVLFMPNTVFEYEKKPRDDSATPEYKIYIFGVLQDGSKTCVIIRNVDIFVDVCLDNTSEAEIKRMSHASFTKSEIIEQYSSDEFREYPTNYLRCFFKNTRFREDFLKSLDILNESLLRQSRPIIKTSHDEQAYNKTMLNGKYFAALARIYRFKTSDWNIVSSYKVLCAGDMRAPAFKHEIFNQDIPENIPYYVLEVSLGPVAARRDAPYTKLRKAMREKLTSAFKKTKSAHSLDKDKMLVLTWDIETHSPDRSAGVPNEKNVDTWALVCIGATLHYQYDPEVLLDFTIGIFPTKPRDDNLLQFVVKDQEAVVRGFLRVIRKLQPDFLESFNGSQFDLVCLLAKLGKYSMIGVEEELKTLSPFNKYVWFIPHKGMKIKTSADSSFDAAEILSIPHMIEWDIRHTFIKAHPKDEVGTKQSLSHYLSIYNLGTKVDMAYELMFRIFDSCLGTLNISELILYIEKEHPDMFVAERGALQLSQITPREFIEAAISEVYYYCKVDSLRVHQLLQKSGILLDYREYSNLSFMPLINSIYLANGSKICNFTQKIAFSNGVAFSSKGNSTVRDSERKSFAGGYVMPPEKGLHADSPVIAYDFSSLYPSIYRAYNLCPSMLVYSEQRADELRKKGYNVMKLPPIQYKKGEKTFVEHAWIVRHNNTFLSPPDSRRIVVGWEKTITYSGNCPRTEKRFIPYNDRVDDLENPAPDDVKALEALQMDILEVGESVSVKYEPVFGREALPHECMGIFGIIMTKLFDKRVPLKKQCGVLKKILENASDVKHNSQEHKEQGVEAQGVKFEGVMYSLEDLHRLYQKLNAKQNAIKIFANSFYGCSGNEVYNIYKLAVAASTTNLGQRNIKLVSSYLKYRKCKPIYGDTDSQYCKMPLEIYDECRAAYERGAITKQTYWEDMIRVAFRKSVAINNEIDDFLIMNNGTLLLRVAYEEVSFPIYLCGRKKYFFREHIGIPNVIGGKIVPKGLDTIKNGKSDITKDLGKLFIEWMMDCGNARTPIAAVCEIIDKYYATTYPIENYVKSYRLKPNVENVSVKNFAARMKVIYEDLLKSSQPHAVLWTPPEYGVPFKAVVVVKEIDFNIRGCKIKQAKSDVMEYLDVYKWSQNEDTPLIIDKFNYAREIFTMLARFISGEAQFLPDLNPNADYKAYDEKSTDNALKFIEKYASKFKVTAAPNNKFYRLIYSRIKTFVDIFNHYWEMMETTEFAPITDVGRRKAIQKKCNQYRADFVAIVATVLDIDLSKQVIALDVEHCVRVVKKTYNEAHNKDAFEVSFRQKTDRKYYEKIMERVFREFEIVSSL